ncbi:hypothetical protein DERF_009567 [Dermatophagoides farinae]|uniref:Uncharacterized protein n=1 Tax=Dermatophagoides farinae TaxID=6954 RepID=A0A922HZG1_DERFA|nr:hypothetical protein DERF_009567 [Dermatophagoides farinae]
MLPITIGHSSKFLSINQPTDQRKLPDFGRFCIHQTSPQVFFSFFIKTTSPSTVIDSQQNKLPPQYIQLIQSI